MRKVAPGKYPFLCYAKHTSLGSRERPGKCPKNIRTAWRWAVQTHNYSGIDRALGGVFRWFWLMRSRQHEGQALLRYALEQWAPAPDEDPRPVWMRLSARIMEQSGPTLIYDPEMVERTDRALDFARQQGNLDEISFCLWAHGFAVLVDHDRDMNTRRPEAIGFLERSLQYYRERGDRFYIAQGLELSGHCYRQLRLIDQAAPRLQESLEIRRALEIRFGMGRSLRELGFVAFLSGLVHETENAWREGLAIRRDLGDQQGIADSLYFLSVLCLVRGDWQQGRTMAEQVTTIAPNIDESVYQKWASRALEIATSMEHAKQSSSEASPGVITTFTAELIVVQSLTFG